MVAVSGSDEVIQGWVWDKHAKTGANSMYNIYVC